MNEPQSPAFRALSPSVLLRIEGAVLATLSFFFFERVGETWWLFLAWPAPDLSFVGYLAGPRVGSILYNLAHLELWPAALVLWGTTADSATIVALGLVWFSHIGVDRLVGYGLKYPTEFKDSHLQRV